MITYGIVHHHLTREEQAFMNIEQGCSPEEIAISIAARNPDIKLSKHHRDAIYGRPKSKYQEVKRVEESKNFDLCQLPRVPYFFKSASYDASKARHVSPLSSKTHQIAVVGKNIKEMY